MHPMQYSTPFEEQRTSLGQGSSETPWTFQNAALAVTQRPQYPTYNQSAASSAQKLPPPTNLFDSSNASPTVTMPKESRGRKTIDDVACHQDLVQKMSIEFFAVGQSLSLYPFCRANGYIEKYNSVWRFISNNPTLKSYQQGQSKTGGFTLGQSEMAIREIVDSSPVKESSYVKSISQLFCQKL